MERVSSPASEQVQDRYSRHYDENCICNVSVFFWQINEDDEMVVDCGVNLMHSVVEK